MGYYRDRAKEIEEELKKKRSAFQTPQEQMREQFMPMQQIRNVQWEALPEQEQLKEPIGPPKELATPKERGIFEPPTNLKELATEVATMPILGPGTVLATRILQQASKEETMPQKEAVAVENWLEISPQAYPFAVAYSKLVETPVNAMASMAMFGIKAGAQLIGAKGVEKKAREMKWIFEHPPITSTVQRDFQKNVQNLMQNNKVAGAMVAQTIESVSDLLAFMTHIGILSGAKGYTPGMIASAPEAAEAMRTGQGATKYIAKHMTRLGGYAFAARPGDITTRLQGAIKMIGYNLTPYIANATGAVGLSAQAIDTGLNTMLSSPEYIQNLQKSKNPMEFIYKSLPTFVMDVGMAWNTRGWPSNRRAKFIKSYLEKQPVTSGIGPVERMKMINRITSKLPPIEKGKRPMSDQEAAKLWRESTPYEKEPATGPRPEIERVYPGKQYYELEKTGTRSYEQRQAAGGEPRPEGQPSSAEAVKAIIESLDATKGMRAALEEAYTKKRGERAKAGEEAFKTTKGQAGFFAAKGKLKGELARQPQYAGIQDKLTQGVVDELYEMVKRDPRYDFWEKIDISEGLTRVLRGELPQPHHYDLLQDVFGPDFVKALFKNRSGMRKFKDIVNQVINLPKAVKASYDFSAPFRQAVFWSMRPSQIKRTAAATKAMFKMAFSEQAYQNFFKEIKQDPLYHLARKHGTYIADPSGVHGLTAKEEAYMTDLPLIIAESPILKYTPLGWAATGIRVSERAFTGYLSKLRWDVTRDMYRDAMKNGSNPRNAAHGKIFDSISRFVNTTTGRGDIHGLANVGAELNALFWSPRFIKSRLDLFNPIYYKQLHPTVRKELIKGLAEMIGTGMTILALSKAAGADVELDPRSTDFGKIRIGRTRWDIWGGHQQYVRVLAQIFSGVRKTSSGKMRKLSAKEWPFEKRTDIAWRFLRGKFAPAPQLALEVFEGQKSYGGDLVPVEEVRDLFIPMVVQDVVEALDEFGPAALFSVGVPGTFGVGVQTYEDTGVPSETTTKKSTEDTFNRFHNKKRKW